MTPSSPPTPQRRARAVLGLLVLALCSAAAQAVPSFSRQTGMDCSGCHVGAFGPQLTPAGMRFKLGGYTDTDGKDGKIPLSAMVVASWARTRHDQDPAPDHLKPNNNTTLDEASLFLAGRLGEQLGGFVQATYNGIDHSVALDQTDLRWARPLQWGGKELLLGVTVNNNPTVQDPLNTLPVWGYPYIGPEAGFGTGEAASLVNGGLSQRVLGASAYAFWDKSLYAELGSYRSLSPSVQRKLGAGDDAQRLAGNVYWRLAWMRDLGARSFSAGVFGWNAALAPDREPGTASDRVRDMGLDASYQFLGTREHIATVSGSLVRERRRLGDGSGTGRLTEQRLNASYHFRNTWGASAGYFDTHGSDPASATRDQLLQLDWTPWGKEDQAAPAPFGWANLRLGAQLWHYSRFGGDSTGASGHDTLHLFAWTAF